RWRPKSRMTSNPASKPRRYASEELASFAASLLAAAGMDSAKADCMARILLLTDMMGRLTHGLAQCANYLDEIKSGQMTTSGAPEVIRDTGATIVWDGRYLPGLWLGDTAIELPPGPRTQA